jgi:hypothetical protein
MSHGTVRISNAAHAALSALARAEKKPMAALLDEAVETLRRQRLLEQTNAAYGRLRADPDAWPEIDAERRAWDATLGDGLAVAEGRAPYGERLSTKRQGRRQKK